MAMTVDSQDYILNFQFVLEEGVNKEAIATELRQRLVAVDDISDVRVSTANRRSIDPATAVAVISVGVLIIKQSAEAVDALAKLVKAVKRLAAEINGVSEARVEVGDQVRRVDAVERGDLEAAARAALE